MKLKGSITIGRLSSGHLPDEMRIELRDETSRTQFVTIYLSLEDFARALTGLGDQAMTFEWRPGLVGTKREWKHEIVSYQKGTRDYDPEVLAKLEVDGWKVSASDLTNHHRWGKEGYTALFTRYVDPVTGKPVDTPKEP